MAVAVASRASDDLTAAERLDALFDRGTTQFIRTDVVSRRLGPRAVPGDGVLAATGTVDGRPVAAYSQDGTVFGGSLGRAHADTVLRVLDVAERARIPVVAFVESAGARLQEGLDALDGYARIFAAQVRLSGVIPQISVVCGAAAGGGAYGPALSDFVVLTPRASMFLTGPGVVREVLGEVLTASELGGPAVHAANGVAHLLSETELDAITTTRTLLEVLADVDAVPRHPRPVEAPPGGPVDAYVPADPRKGYDVRHVAAGLVDGGRLLEISPGWAPNVTCSFGRIEGRAVGIVANQPSCKAGVLDADASQKAARFVRTCDVFRVPLVVLVDTPGFMPGSEQEGGAVIRHGAKLVHAFADATVPRVTVVLRKAFGGALIAMNSRGLGADAVFAWPNAELGVMGPAQAVGITHRRDIEAAADPVARRSELAGAYAADHLTAERAAQDGHVDAVIAPSDTRARVAAVLALAGTTVPLSRPARNFPQ